MSIPNPTLEEATAVPLATATVDAHRSRAVGGRLWAGAIRVALLYAILCCAVAIGVVAVQEGRAAGWGLGRALPPLDGPVFKVAPLGVTVELAGKSPAEQSAALRRLAEGGFGWVRLRADWAALEPHPGDFDWEALDGLLDRVAASGLEAVVVLDNSPAWARDPLDQSAQIASPEHPEDFAAFARTFARRYGSKVRFYQIWDEPNITPHWGNRLIDPVGYAQLLRTGAEAIRNADPDAVILTAALAPTNDRGHLAIDEPRFLQRMIAAGAAGSFDAVAAEPFGFGDAPATTGATGRRLNFQRLALIRRTLVAAGQASTPIWAVRFGWNTRGDSPWATVTAAAQQRYLAEARAVAARWPWLATMGWAVDQPDAPASDPVWGFALRDDLLPAFTVPLHSLPAPDGSAPARTLALMIAMAVVALGVAWPSIRRLPYVTLRRRYGTLAVWVQAAPWVALIVIYYLATWPPLIGACWIAGALLAFVAPQAGVWVALSSLPFYYRHKEVTLGATVVEVVPLVATAMILAPITAIGAWRAWRSTVHPWRQLSWADGLVVAWPVLGALAAVNVWNWAGYARGLLEIVVAPVILYVAVRLFVKDPVATRRALAALFAGGLLVAVIGFVRWFSGDGVVVDGVRRLVGPQFSPNHTALYLVRTLFVGLGLALGTHGRLRGIWLALTALVGAALMLTASRGALILGIPAGAATCVWLWWLRGDLPLGERIRGLLRRPLVRTVIVAAPLLIVAAVLLGEARLLNAESVDNRLLLWRAALRLARDVSLVGAGPGGFYWRYPAYLPMGALLEPSLQHPHNVWLEMATGWGVLGLAWIGLLLTGWLLTAARRLTAIETTMQWPAIGLTAALVAALAHGQVDAFLALPDLAGWLFAALALQMALFRRRPVVH